MTKENPASLRVPANHYRTADLVIGIVFLIAAVIGGYFALVQGVRDFWLLLVVGLIGGFLRLRNLGAKDVGE